MSRTPPARTSVTAAASGAVVVAACFALLFPDAFARLPFAGRLAAGLAVVLLVPGRLLLQVCWARERLDSWESFPFSFAASLCWITPLTVLSIELHASSTWAAWVLLLGCAVLLFLSWRSPAFIPSTPPSLPGFTATALLGLALLGYLLYGIGGLKGPDSVAELGEEALQLATVRKLAENESLTRENLMYKAGVPATYVYPPYHFALALVSRISGIDPLAVFIKWRPLPGLVSLLSLYGILRIWLTPRWLADVGLLLLVALAFQDVGATFVGQLVPVSHWVDFGVGVMLPLLALSVSRYAVASEGHRFLAFVSWFTATTLLVHTREVLQLLVYLGPAIVALLLFARGERRAASRAALFTVIAVALGLAYRELHGEIARHAVTFEAAHRQESWRELLRLLERPVLDVVFEPGTAYRYAQRPLFLLPLAAAPFLLVARPRFFTLFLWGGLMIGILIARVPHFSLLYVNLTYSEMLMMPPRHFHPWGHLFYALAGCFGVFVCDRLFRLLRRGARVATKSREWRWSASSRAARLSVPATLVAAGLYGAIVLGLGSRALAALSYEHVDLLNAWAVLGSTGAAVVLWRRRGRAAPGGFLDSELLHRKWSLVWSGVMLLAFTLLSSQPTLWVKHRRLATMHDAADFNTWYSGSRLSEMVPRHLLRFLKEAVPFGQVIAYRYDRMFAIPVVSNHYVLSSGTPLSTELDFADTYLAVTGKKYRFPEDPYQALVGRTRYVLDVIRDNNPLFREDETPRETLALLDAFSVDYVIASPDERLRWAALSNDRPDVLEKAYDREGYLVLKVKRP